MRREVDQLKGQVEALTIAMTVILEKLQELNMREATSESIFGLAKFTVEQLAKEGHSDELIDGVKETIDRLR